MRTIESRRSRATFLWIMGCFTFVMLIAYAVHLAGARINWTPSLPRGIYWTVAKTPERGDMVVFSPPSTPVFLDAVQRGYVHRSLSGVGPGALLKEIAAVSGDYVTATANGVTVNGILLENSIPVYQDAHGRVLAPTFLENYQLAPDEVFLFSEHNPDSFDSRYFGVQSLEHVKDVVKPVLIYVP